MHLSVFFLLLPHLRVAQDSPCVCTSVPCPVVVKGAGIINQLSLHDGTDTT